jgi:hypothetical protein
MNPAVEVLLLMDHQEQLQRARELMEERTTQVQSGLLQEHGPVGLFVAQGGDSYTFQPNGKEIAHGRIHLAQGDWTQERVLFNLTGDFGTVHNCDLVVLLSDETENADARTSMALLKLAHAVGEQTDQFAPHFQVIGQVDEQDLAWRLEERYRTETSASYRPVRVIANEELRALFSFQSAMVPGFDAIYSDIMSPSGPSLVRLLPEPHPEQSERLWSFDELARSLAARGQVALALVYKHESGQGQLVIAPSSKRSSDCFRMDELEAVWVLGDRDQA